MNVTPEQRQAVKETLGCLALTLVLGVLVVGAIVLLSEVAP